MYANVPNIRLTKKIRHDKEKQHDVIDDGDSDDESFDDVPQQQQQLQSICLLYTSPSPRDATLSRMPSSA